MTNLAITTVIDEIKCVYTQLDTDNQLWEIPFGPSELLAWTAAYNKLVVNKRK